MTTDKELLARSIKAAKDGNYTLKIEPCNKTITHRQRKYFFGVIVKQLQLEFADKGMGITQQECIDFLKDKFIFRETYNPISDETLKVPISLSSKKNALDKNEFNTAKENIQRWAAEYLNLVIEDPKEPIFND